MPRFDDRKTKSPSDLAPHFKGFEATSIEVPAGPMLPAADIEPGQPCDATRTVERLLAVLDRSDVVHALDRIKRRRMMRLVE